MKPESLNRIYNFQPEKKEPTLLDGHIKPSGNIFLCNKRVNRKLTAGHDRMGKSLALREI